MVYTLLTFVHVLVCLFLIVVVLLQSGKAADLAGAFGGMGSQTAFGPRGSATLLAEGASGRARGGAIHGYVALAFDFGDATGWSDRRKSDFGQASRSNLNQTSCEHDD